MPGREITIKKYNLDLYDPYETDGPFEMPVIKKTLHIPKELIGFNEAISSKNYQAGIHMFIDDYQFERIWNTPERYVNILKQYDCILTPDFSLYMDMPRAMKVWNIYRSRLIGQYLQNLGICVIPTVSWAERETYTFCFDGIEPGGVVAISTIGCIKDEYARSIWKDGVDYMIDKLKPTAILIYGQSIEHDFKGTKVIYYKNKVIERARKHGGRGASSGVSDSGKPYGSEYNTVYQSGYIKFVKQVNASNAKAPMETMTRGRVYATVNDKDEISSISYYDNSNKRTKQIDLTHDHQNMKPHTHHGYYHSEHDGKKGATNLTAEERKMVDRVKRLWLNKNKKR